MRCKFIGVFLILFVMISVSGYAQLYKPFASFRVIKTEYFDIIFPRESESSARMLAAYADSTYEQMSALFGIKVPGRIPVTFAPHTDMFNGYYNPIPYPHIVLFDTPMDIEWTTFSNSLEGLFIHELAHAVSLNTRSSFFRVIRNIFGNWVTPSAINAPAFMVEGVTIMMESQTGLGRANDPLIKQKLRQAIHEDSFLTPFQAAGVNDLPGQRSMFYEYGGLFSAWLVETYGMEKYTELWRAMGRSIRFSFIVYRSGYYRIFRNVYGINFLDAWNAFRDSLELDDLEENSEELLPERYRFLTEKRYSVSAIASRGNNVYILDGSEERIRVYDTMTDNVRNFKINSFASYDLDVSPDGKTALVSGYQLTGERYRALVTEYETASGRKTGRAIKGLYKARYFRDGIIGIRSELHNTCIVYEEFNGKTETLFSGNSELLFSGPQAIDNERIAFIAARNGERELMLYNFVTGELFRVASGAEDGSFGRYMRGLGVSEGKLFFSHNSDDRMYKLGFIDLESMKAVLSNRDFSGGVFYPAASDSNVYYRGAFFSGDSFLRFPETTNEISGNEVNISFVKIDGSAYGLAPDRNIEEQIPVSAPYFGIKYLNPFKFWLPLTLTRISIDDDDKLKISLDGIGLISVLMDPTDRNLFIVMAYADIAYGMARFDSFIWQCTVPGFVLTTEFSDIVWAEDVINPYRDTRLALSGSFTRYPGRWAYGLTVGMGYFRIAESPEPDSAFSGSAYGWRDNSISAITLLAGISFSNMRRRQHEIFGTGLSASFRGISLAEEFFPRIEGIFQASAEKRFPLNLTLYGAYDENGMNLHGNSLFGQPLFNNAASKEYKNTKGFGLTWLAGGEISTGLFSVEIQNNISHAYFNRFYGTLTLRNVLYDSGGDVDTEGLEINSLRLAQSLILNLKIVTAFLPLKSAPVFIEPHIWGAWKFSNTITGQGLPLMAGFGFNLQY